MLPQITGEFRLVADPELRFAPSGVAVGSARIVASSRKKDDSGEWVDDKTCWLRLTAFKRLAENLAESFTKGDLITVTGRLHTSEFEDRDGNKRQSYEVTADTIGMSVAFKAARAIQTDRPASGGGGASTATAPAEDPWQTPPQGDEPPF